ncbi:integrase [Enteractinococcus helveticum]|uniref:Integrase n=1 Tax=Enteractinococcus helveticum TaxID=1837282 RepID=A0A1B7LVS6_9MICC|nr:integrase [Enteractinococcus helveticum]
MAKYEFIESHKDSPNPWWTIVHMCAWLGVSRSGYYHWRSRPQSTTAARREELAARIRFYFDDSDQTYGYRRVHADLVAEGTQASLELVRQIMVEQNMIACQPRPFRVTTDPDADAAASIPDLVQRDFSASAPGQKFVGDVTYIHTWQGFMYLATVIDCYSRKVVGFSMADHLRAELVVQALDNAAATTVIQQDAIFHSDKGVQYSSKDFQAALARHEMRASMGRTGVCWDNSLAESFFAALKNECVYRTVYPTKAHAKRDVFRYIEAFYNTRRRHSALDYQRPAEVHYGGLQLATAA